MKGQDPTPAELKRLKVIGSQMRKLNNEIRKMGYEVYLAMDVANVMKGDHHDNRAHSAEHNIVYSFTLEGWDGGDW